MSYLPFIEKVDLFPYDKGTNGFYEFISHDGVVIGYISKAIAEFFALETGISVSDLKVKIDEAFDTEEKRNALFAEIGSKWKHLDFFTEDLKHAWRDELYTVYAPTNKVYMRIERAFSVLLGVVTYGVHVNGYVPSHKSADGKLKLWVPRRSKTKPTFPAMLDNTVAGGLGYPYGLWETVVKESYEEAGLELLFVETHTKNAGVVLYLYYPSGRKIERVQPEVEYIYDMQFDDESSVVPKPVDGEAEDFRLMDVDEVLTRLKAGEFKPNCLLVVIDFLIRHGIVTAENEPRFLEIQSRCHRRIPFPTM